MRPLPALTCRLARASVAAAGFLILVACSGDANPVRDIVVGVGAGPPPANTPDFVARTRPARLDYIPVGTSAPDRPTKARTADEVKAAEAEMDAARAANEAAAGAARADNAPPAAAPQKRKPKPGEPKRP